MKRGMTLVALALSLSACSGETPPTETVSVTGPTTTVTQPAATVTAPAATVTAPAVTVTETADADGVVLDADAAQSCSDALLSSERLMGYYREALSLARDVMQGDVGYGEGADSLEALNAKIDADLEIYERDGMLCIFQLA